MKRENKTEILRLRAEPKTVEKLDRLATAVNGNRSELIRQLIEQAASTGQQLQQPQEQQSWPVMA